MRQKRLPVVVVVLTVVTVLAVLGLASCGFKRKLVSITVIPNKVTLGGPDLSVQFKAIGNYIHPPDSRDITDSVVWESAAPDVVSINATGLATSGLACGTNITITATAFSHPASKSGSVVIGTATVDVTCPGAVAH